MINATIENAEAMMLIAYHLRGEGDYTLSAELDAAAKQIVIMVMRREA